MDRLHREYVWKEMLLGRRIHLTLSVSMFHLVNLSKAKQIQITPKYRLYPLGAPLITTFSDRINKGF